MVEEKKNEALEAEGEYRTAVEEAYDYIENFDLLETITNVGNDEVFTPRKTCDMMLDSLPEEVWHNPNYKWLNPATKNGIFEREIAIRLDKGLEDVIPDVEQRRKHILKNMIYSIGQTKFTSNVARRTVYYCSQANRKCDGIRASDGHFVNGYAIGNGSWFDNEEGNILTPNADHLFEDSSGRLMPSSVKEEDRKKYKCKFCGITGDSKYNDMNQRETYAYEFIHYHRLVLLKKLQDRFFGGDRNMKFDIIIGNPPYQLSTGGGQAQAKPIYHKFIEQCILLSPKYLCMIVPSRWFAGGIGLDDFRAKTLKDKHFSKIVDYVQSEVCFPGVVIAGGVNYFIWERDKTGLCEYTYIDKGIKHTALRDLGENDIFIRNNEAMAIIEKIRQKDKSKLSTIMSALSPFGLNSNFRGHKNKENDDYEVLSSNGWAYASKSEINQGYEYINKYKVAISYATSGSGATADKDGQRKVLAKLFLLKPGQVCTFTYFLCGKFDSEIEANNCLKYLSTKFVRYLLFQSLSGIHVSRDKFDFVPLVDFSKTWNDSELYDKYGLSEEEKALIESSIKEMN